MLMPILEGMGIDTEGMKIARSWEYFVELGGTPVDAMDRCFGLEHSNNQSETRVETLDTLPVTP